MWCKEKTETEFPISVLTFLFWGNDEMIRVRELLEIKFKKKNNIK